MAHEPLSDAVIARMEADALEQLAALEIGIVPEEGIPIEEADELDGLVHPHMEDELVVDPSGELSPEIGAPVELVVEPDVSIGIYSRYPNRKIKFGWGELTYYERGQYYATCRHGHGDCRLVRTASRWNSASPAENNLVFLLAWLKAGSNPDVTLASTHKWDTIVTLQMREKAALDILGHYDLFKPLIEIT